MNDYFNAPVTFEGERSTASSSLTFPTTFTVPADFNSGYYGPNFQFSSVPELDRNLSSSEIIQLQTDALGDMVVIPEPASLLLAAMMVFLAGGVLYSRKLKKVVICSTTS